MPIFGGIRADVLQFLLGLCPLRTVQANYHGREEVTFSELCKRETASGK
jgi:hypothetical protein